MVSIGCNIFCRATTLQNALGASNSPRHIVRRLVNGVFTHEAVLKSTVSGQEYRPGLNKEENQDKTKPDVLHQGATTAIISIVFYS